MKQLQHQVLRVTKTIKKVLMKVRDRQHQHNNEMERQPLFSTERSCVVFMEQSFLQCITEMSAKTVLTMTALVSCNNRASNKHLTVRSNVGKHGACSPTNQTKTSCRVKVTLTPRHCTTSSSSKDTQQLQHFKSVTGFD